MRSARLAAVLGLALAAACGGGPGEAPHAAKLGDDAIRDRVASYFRKASDTPGVAVAVTELGPSHTPDWKKGVLEASLGGQRQEIQFMVSDDGRWLIRGETIDLSLDPTEAVMRRIRLDGQPSRGPADAKATLVEWSDFQCPYCGQAWEILEKQVLTAYGDRVRFVFKQMPLSQIHPWAERAALASECALRQGNDQFWVVYNGLFRNQGTITADNFTAKLDEIAAGSSIDLPRLRECVEKQETLAEVRADVREAQALGINGTPSFILNGRPVNGAQSFDAFKQAIDKALAASG